MRVVQPHNYILRMMKTYILFYGLTSKYGSNWVFVYLCKPNQEDNFRMKECTKHIQEDQRTHGHPHGNLGV